MELIDQQVIKDNKEIYAKIQSELIKAKSEILIVTAWFTDDDLFDILIGKLAEGVHVEVIVADNQENERLDFGLLTLKGASVYKIKNSGYGGMNQKFCVIDKHIALHGSYNWTHNAKKNNQESIISTDHQETIDSLIDNFNELKNRIANQPATIAAPKPDKPKGIPVEIPLKAGAEFEKVLDSMIAAEVGSFDRELLRKQGFDRSQANSGDHQVLYKAFDTVYSVFINDMDVIEDKKKRLIAKIDEYRVKTNDALGKTCELEIAHLEEESQLNKSNFEAQKNRLTAEVDLANKNIEEVKTDKIPAIQTQNDELDKQIKDKEREFIRPKFKLFELVPTAVVNAILVCYLFVFYSSAAYILLFSVNDAEEMQKQGIDIPPPQIFNAHAVSKAAEKGWIAVMFICLFVIIPFSFALVERFVKSRWIAYPLFAFGIIGLDGAVAYEVAAAIHAVNYRRGDVNVPWTGSMAFSDTNFYLVFVFGAMGLLMFKFAFKKLMQSFEDRNPDILAQRNQLLIKQLKGEVEANAVKIQILKEEIGEFDRNIIHHKANIKQAELELASLPLTLNNGLQKKRSQLIRDTETIDKIAVIYTLHIQSDNLPISVDALKDRINVFLEGWNDFLYQEYAIPKAAEKTTKAAETAANWQNDKLERSHIDKRVKFNTGE